MLWPISSVYIDPHSFDRVRAPEHLKDIACNPFKNLSSVTSRHIPNIQHKFQPCSITLRSQSLQIWEMMVTILVPTTKAVASVTIRNWVLQRCRVSPRVSFSPQASALPGCQGDDSVPTKLQSRLAGNPRVLAGCCYSRSQNCCIKAEEACSLMCCAAAGPSLQAPAVCIRTVFGVLHFASGNLLGSCNSYPEVYWGLHTMQWQELASCSFRLRPDLSCEQMLQHSVHAHVTQCTANTKPG